MNNKGQSALAEHVMVFFVVIAALVAMTTYVQRTFEARIHDARNYMINQVMNNSVCDANCLAATGNQITYEYEPYYEVVSSAVSSNGADSQEDTTGKASSIGAKYYNIVNESTGLNSTSAQLSPECADSADPKPAFCYPGL